MIARNEDGNYVTYAWPGGYPIYLVVDDSEALCVNCGNTEPSVHEGEPDDGWRVIASEVNYEDPALFCCHCNVRIESAYAEDEANV